MSTGGQQRDAILTLAPPWLADISPAQNGGQGGVGGRYLYTLGLASDALLEKLNQAEKAHMPTVCDPSALPIIGQDRVMTQGPGETDDAFRVRLQEAFETWQHAGESRSVLELVAAYTRGQQGAAAYAQGQQIPVWPIASVVSGYQAKKWDWYTSADDTTKPPEHFQYRGSDPQTWSWDGNEVALWFRAWLVLYAFMLAPTSASASCAVASIADGFVTLTGLSGIPADVTSLTRPGYLTLTGAANAGNNGTFQIVQYVTATSVVVANPNGVFPDANSGLILALGPSYYPGLQPTPVVGFPGATVGSVPSVGVMLGDGSSATGFFGQLRALLSLWKSAQTLYLNIVVSFDGDNLAPSSGAFSPWSGEGSGNPDGTWGTWAKIVGGIAVPARVTGLPMGNFNDYADGT